MIHRVAMVNIPVLPNVSVCYIRPILMNTPIYSL